MADLNQTIRELHMMDEIAGKKGFLRKIHPIVKLFVTILFCLTIMSFGKYQMVGFIWMACYLTAQFILEEQSFLGIGKRLWPMFLLVSMVGIANLFLDRTVFFWIGGIPVTGGMLSFLSLACKGIFAVLAAYFFVMSTTMEELCYALWMLHVPTEIITMLMLMNRYLIVFIKEIARLNTAYQMRAPGQKGFHISTWGAVVGRLLIGSVDRAQIVYESMKLRGFHGQFFFSESETDKKWSVLFGAFWGLWFGFVRFVISRG